MSKAECPNCYQIAVSTRQVFKETKPPPPPTIEQLITNAKYAGPFFGSGVLQYPTPIQVVASCANCGYTIVWNREEDEKENLCK
jgi:hypothetical protein